MSTTTPIAHLPSAFVLRSNKREWKFYHLSTDLGGNPTVDAKHTVKRIRGKASCTCSAFHSADQCKHTRVLKYNYPAESSKRVPKSESVHSHYLDEDMVTPLAFPTPIHAETGDLCVIPKDSKYLTAFPPPSPDTPLDEFITTFRSSGVSHTHTYQRLVHDLEHMFLKHREPSLAYKAPETIIYVNREMEFPSAISTFTAATGKGKPWEGVPKPAGFSVSDEDWRVLLYCLTKAKPVMLIGGTGCGKTELVAHAVDALDRDLESFNCGAMQNPRTSLIGRTHLNDKGTFFKKARFVEAVTEDNMVILADEISRSSVDVFNILLPVLDRQGYISIDESEETEQVFVAPTVAIVATANIGSEYTGTTQIDRALSDRFLKINLDYPQPEEEVRVLRDRYEVPKQWVTDLVNCAWSQRKLAREDEFSIEISTRMLFDTVQMVADGIPAREAVGASILSAFASDGGEDSEQANVRLLFSRSNML